MYYLHCLRYYEQQNRIYILNKQLTYRSNLSESHSPSQEMNCGGSRDAVERLTTGKKHFVAYMMFSADISTS